MASLRLNLGELTPSQAALVKRRATRAARWVQTRLTLAERNVEVITRADRGARVAPDVPRSDRLHRAR